MRQITEQIPLYVAPFVFSRNKVGRKRGRDGVYTLI